MTITQRLQKGLDFSRDAHESINQVRKGGGKYFFHPQEVMYRLDREGIVDEDMLIAALLHDVLEDVYPENDFWSPELIKTQFGSRVLRFVFELTDVFTKQAFPQYNRAERKLQEAIRLSSVSDQAKVIKTADIWHNGLSLDVIGGFGGVWRKEKKFLLPLLEPDNETYKGVYFNISI